jgi:protein-S-isoprenylcysteine O-methyltransferase Ste14
MIRQATRRRISQVISEQYLGAVFSIASGITLLALVLLWQETALVAAAADGLWRWSLRAVFFLGIAGQVWGIRSLKSPDLFGTETVLRRSGPTPPSAPMVVRGPYRWVRHPLYLATLLMIWSYPDLTADRLLFNVLFTAWIVLGAVLEERDLVADYGDGYRNYQRRVPMLIPYRKPIEA